MNEVYICIISVAPDIRMSAIFYFTTAILVLIAALVTFLALQKNVSSFMQSLGFVTWICKRFAGYR